MYFTVEEENLICLYHNADRRRLRKCFIRRTVRKRKRKQLFFRLRTSVNTGTVKITI